jgi:hypothetical protein
MGPARARGNASLAAGLNEVTNGSQRLRVDCTEDATNEQPAPDKIMWCPANQLSRAISNRVNEFCQICRLGALRMGNMSKHRLSHHRAILDIYVAHVGCAFASLAHASTATQDNVSLGSNSGVDIYDNNSTKLAEAAVYMFQL